MDISTIFQKYQSQLKGFIAKRISGKEDREDILQDVLQTPSNRPRGSSHRADFVVAVLRHPQPNHRQEPKIQGRKTDNPRRGIRRTLTIKRGIRIPVQFGYLSRERIHPHPRVGGTGQRTVFELTELQGFSFKEISASTGIPVNTLISRKRYAVLYLRDNLYELYKELLND